MSEWLAIAEWPRCQALARPGIAFEIRNAEGLTMLTQCVIPAPDKPFDWASPGIEFRAVALPPPVHSAPLPPPRG